MACVGISSLKLHYFRSFTSAFLSTDSQHIVLTGDNGVGKTNILEAISFFSPGRGLRKSKLSDISTLNENEPWAVAIELCEGSDVLRIGTGLDPRNSARRIVKLQGEELSTHLELSNFLHVNWVTPAMDRIFLESSQNRRRFFDHLVYGVDPLHAKRLSKFEHAMRERSRLLKDRQYHAKWLEVLEQTMAEESVAIASSRLNALDLMQQAQPMSDDPFFPMAQLKFVQGIECDLSENTALEVEENMRQRLAMNRQEDGFTGRASMGAHKMDFTAIHVLKNMEASMCSTGEQKILLMWIVLAFVEIQKRYAEVPSILLLDEVAAHLDQNRREILFNKINSLGVQAWYTGTDMSLFAALQEKESTFFHLEQGQAVSVV